MASSEMNLASGTVKGDVLVATVEVPHIRDPKVSYELRDRILSLIESAGARHVVVDLGKVTFMSSVGLLALLAVRRRVAPGLMVICNLSDAIREMLELCLLISNDPAKTAPFQAEESVEAALARLAG